MAKPPCPHWLDGIAKYAYKELGELLKDIKVMTVADKKALELLCDAYSEYRRARDVLLKDGFTFESHCVDKDGNEYVSMVRPRPENQIAQSAWRRCSDMLKQFGLTPSSRTGVEQLGEEKGDPLDQWMKNGKKLQPVKGGKK